MKDTLFGRLDKINYARAIKYYTNTLDGKGRDTCTAKEKRR
jgi:hypothetical protein